jgi:hypothetical protein
VEPPNSPDGSVFTLPANAPGDDQYIIEDQVISEATINESTFIVTLPADVEVTLTGQTSPEPGQGFYVDSVNAPDGSQILGVVVLGLDAAEGGVPSESFQTQVAGQYSITTDTGAFDSPFTLTVAFSAPASLTLSTPNDNETADDQFGPYLVGVPFKNPFTVTVNNDPGTVAEIDYTAGGKMGKAQRVGQTSQWTFSLDVGSLPATGNQTITLDAFDANHNPVVPEATDTLVMQHSLNFAALTTTDPGTKATVDATALRFIQGIPLPLDFTGTITDLPSYYADTAVFPTVGVGSPVQPVKITSFTATGSVGATFTFPFDAANLSGGVGQLMPNDVELLVPTPGGSGAILTYLGKKDLQALALPSWMGTPTSATFATTPDVNAALPGAGGGYVINLQYQLNPTVPVPLPTTSTDDVLGTLLDNLQGSINTGLNLTVYATLDESQATIRPTNWFAQAMLLGTPLFSQGGQIPTGTGGVSVHVNLNPATLGAPKEVDITASDVKLLAPPAITPAIDLPFNQGKTFTLPVSIPFVSWFTLGLIHGEVALTGDFKASLDDLTADAFLAIKIGAGVPTLDGTQSYFELSADASAALTFTAVASINAGFDFGVLDTKAEATLVSAHASGTVSAAIDAVAKIDLDGSLTAPKFKLDEAGTYACATLGVGFSVGASAGEGPAGPPPEPDFSKSEPFALYGTCPMMASTDDADLSGPGQKASPGFPGVQPTSGTNLALLGPAPGSSAATTSTPAQAAAALAPVTGIAPMASPAATASVPTSTLTIRTPIAGSVSDLKFDLNVLADHATLTPGHHFLDVVLVDPAGDAVSLAHIDLSGSALATNNNPLGFASGWSTIDAPPPAGALDPGNSYLIEFRLTNDRDGTGEAVAAAIDNLKIAQPTPQLAPSIAGVPAGGPLVFGPDTGGTGTATIDLANSGAAALILSSVSLAGAGFTLPNAPSAPFDLDPGQSLNLQVQLLDPTQPASAALTITSDDPTQPTYTLPLQYDGKSVSNSPQTTSLSAVSGAGTFNGTGSLTATLTAGGSPLAGKTVAFTLNEGGTVTPVGMATTDANGVATLTGIGLAGLGAGTVSGAVGADFAGDASDASSTGSGDLTVSPAQATLSLSGLAFTYDGSPHTATVITNPAGLSGVSVSYAQNNVAMAGPIKAGSYTVTATLNNPNYTAMSVTGTLVIHQATPAITWPSPADITAGTPLGSAQLDATASVQGTFSYNPAAGKVLNPGQGQTLAVTFTPTDRTDYAMASGSTLINVLSAPPPPTPPQATGIVGVGHSRKGLISITIGFNEALERSSVVNPSLYSVLGAVTKRKKTLYSKALVIQSITYDGNTHVTINLAKPFKGAVQVTVRTGIAATNGTSSGSSFSAITK